jgi:DNA-binding HxlR family transcriptional regulator
MSLHESKTADVGQCPIREVLDRAGDRWSMLAQTLRWLELDGLLSSRFHATMPPRVEYTLTPLGISQLGPIRERVRWTRANYRRMRAARRSYGPPVRPAAL